jgi:UPF0716 family protein affecting phage T7 exclusion
MHAARGLLLALGIGLPRAQCTDVLHAIQRAMQRGNVATWQRGNLMCEGCVWIRDDTG